MLRNCLLILVVIFAQCSFVLKAQQPNYSQYASYILNECLSLNKGDVVTIYGASHSKSLVTDIVSESNAIGAYVSSIITNDSLERLKVTDAVTSNAFQKKVLDMLRPTQYLVIIDPMIADPKFVYHGVSADKISIAHQSEQDFTDNILKKRVRILRVTIPTAYAARKLNKSLEEYKSMQLQASMIDIETMLPNMKRLEGLLKNGNRIKITTSTGTDFTFTIGGEPMVSKDGRITSQETSNPAFRAIEEIPPGTIELTVRVNSGNGTVNLPFVECDYSTIRDLSFKFVNGSIQDFVAKEDGQCFESKLKDRNLINKLGSVSFCFNYELKVIEHEGCRFWREAQQGIVWITVGSNQRLGGSIPARSPSFSFPIIGPTIEIDGKIALKSPQ